MAGDIALLDHSSHVKRTVNSNKTTLSHAALLTELDIALNNIISVISVLAVVLLFAEFAENVLSATIEELLKLFLMAFWADLIRDDITWHIHIIH